MCTSAPQRIKIGQNAAGDRVDNEILESLLFSGPKSTRKNASWREVEQIALLFLSELPTCRQKVEHFLYLRPAAN